MKIRWMPSGAYQLDNGGFLIDDFAAKHSNIRVLGVPPDGSTVTAKGLVLGDAKIVEVTGHRGASAVTICVPGEASFGMFTIHEGYIFGCNAKPGETRRYAIVELPEPVAESGEKDVPKLRFNSYDDLLAGVVCALNEYGPNPEPVAKYLSSYFGIEWPHPENATARRTIDRLNALAASPPVVERSEPKWKPDGAEHYVGFFQFPGDEFYGWVGKKYGETWLWALRAPCSGWDGDVANAESSTGILRQVFAKAREMGLVPPEKPKHRLVRCVECKQSPPDRPKSKYCGDGSDKDHSHNYQLVEGQFDPQLKTPDDLKITHPVYGQKFLGQHNEVELWLLPVKGEEKVVSIGSDNRVHQMAYVSAYPFVADENSNEAVRRAIALGLVTEAGEKEMQSDRSVSVSIGNTRYWLGHDGTHPILWEQRGKGEPTAWLTENLHEPKDQAETDACWAAASERKSPGS